MNVQQVEDEEIQQGKPKRDAEATQEKILEQAAQLFAAGGFDNTSMAQIAKAAGVARGTPHYFFGNKEGLFQACFERENAKGLGVIPEALARVGEAATPAEIVDSLIDVYLDFLENNPIFFRLLQWASLENSRLVDAVSAHWETIVGAFHLAEELARESDFADDIPQLVYSIIGLCTVHYSFGTCLGNPMHVTLDEAFLLQRKAHIKRIVMKLLEVK